MIKIYQTFRQGLLKLSFLGLCFVLFGCDLKSPNPAPTSQKDGTTKPRPGDTPSVGDAGGADKIYSTEDEVKAEIQSAFNQFRNNSFAPNPEASYFDTLNLVYDLIRFVRQMPQAPQQKTLTISQILGLSTKEKLKSDPLLWTYILRVTQAEGKLLQQLTEKIKDGKELREHLMSAQIEYSMDKCAADLNHKAAAVSAHDKSAIYCFNLEYLQKIPRNGLHQELIGFIAHEVTHTLGFREADAVLIHNLSRNSWPILKQYYALNRFLQLEQSIDDLLEFKIMVIPYFIEKEADSLRRLTDVDGAINNIGKVLQDLVFQPDRILRDRAGSAEVIQSHELADYFMSSDISFAWSIIELAFAGRRLDINNAPQESIEKGEGALKQTYCDLLGYFSSIWKTLLFEEYFKTHPDARILHIFSQGPAHIRRGRIVPGPYPFPEFAGQCQSEENLYFVRPENEQDSDEDPFDWDLFQIQ